MRFSILVPSYNTPIELLTQCFSSIINQTTKYGQRFLDFQVVFCFDGKSKIHEIHSNHISSLANDITGWKPFIETVTTKERLGVSGVRQHLLDRAMGDWVIWCDSDDILMPFTLDTLEDYIVKNQNKYNCYSYKANITGELEYSKEMIDNYVGDYEYGDVQKDDREFRKLPECLWQKCISRKFLLDHNIRFNPEISLYDDWYFHNILCSYPVKAYKIDKALYEYKIRENSLSTNSEKENKRSYILEVKDKLIKDLEIRHTKYSKKRSIIDIDLQCFKNRVEGYCRDFIR